MPVVCHLTSVHPPDDTRIYHKMCRSLADSSFDVVLIAQAGRTTDPRVRHVVLPPAGSRLRRMVRGSIGLLYRALELKADVYHFHDPELILIGFALKVLGKRVIYDVHEDLPRQIQAKEWIPAYVRRPLGWVCEAVERMAGFVFDGVVAATPRIASRFPARKTVCVQNFPLLTEFGREPAPYEGRPSEVSYVGGLADVRGLYEMIEAFSGNVRQDVRLKLAGPFSDAATESAARTKAEKAPAVDLVGRLQRDGVIHLLDRARAGLCVLRPIPNYMNEPYPVKVFEYMGAGVPVIASDFPIWRAFLEPIGSALFVDPLDPAAIREAAYWIVDHPNEAAAMGKKGREAVLARYHWDHEFEKLLAQYRRVLGASLTA